MKRESVRALRYENSAYAVFDDHGMTWPLPGEQMGNLEWKLRYSKLSRVEELFAASVVAAYAQLVTGNDETRRLIARGIKQAMKE